jgi:murein DD-endopeptidase MepM/ murein hydrolase activator NlpD
VAAPLMVGLVTAVAALAVAPPAITPSPQTVARRADVAVRRSGFVFPVGGPARIGTETAQRFGGLRGHLGQDVFARCGTPVLAARGGVVRRATYEPAAGNYAVVDAADGRSYVYMHLRGPARAGEGDAVVPGQRVGTVGRTGDADGCHLHFEVWTPPGWYSGGRAIDPYGTLRRTQP